jgi:hypothetical protein
MPALARRDDLCAVGLRKHARQAPIFLAHDRLPPASFIANSSRTHAISVWKSFHVKTLTQINCFTTNFWAAPIYSKLLRFTKLPSNRL